MSRFDIQRRPSTDVEESDVDESTTEHKIKTQVENDDIMTLALKEAIAGVGGTIFSCSIVYPIDFVKMRLQLPGSKYLSMFHAMKSIVLEEGFSTLYTGLKSELLKAAIQHFIYIYVYSLLRDSYLRMNARAIAADTVRRHSQYQLSNKNQLTRNVTRGKCAYCEANAVSPDTSSLCTCIPLRTSTLHLRAAALAAEQDEVELLLQQQNQPDNYEDAATEALLVDARHRKQKALDAMAKKNAKAIEAAAAASAQLPSSSPSPSSSSSLKPSPSVYVPATLNLAIGVAAGVANQIVVTPLSVVQTRIMTATKQAAGANLNVKPKGIIEMFMHILRTEGIQALFSGLIPSLILTTNPAIQFLCYDRLKSAILLMRASALNVPLTRNSQLPPLITFFVGAIAKIVATIITYPYIMAKVRLQYKGAEQYRGTLDVIQSILRKDGLFGLYAGLQAQMWKSVLGASLMFMGKEQIMAVSENIVDFMIQLIHNPRGTTKKFA